MKTILALLLCVLVMLQVRLWTGPGSVADIARLERAIAEQNAENAQLDARNDVLMQEVSDLRNGLDSIEERARNELGLIREGETFYLIVDEEPKLKAPEPAIDAAMPADSFAGENIAPEPPPEIVADDNPYLEIFRDGEEPASQASAAAGSTQTGQ